jgi:hypothetical protein
MAVKSIVSIILFISALHFPPQEGWARPTTEDEARNVAVNWLSLESKPMGSSLGHEVKSVETFTDEFGDPVYYAVHLLPSGLIFLPADDQVEPIIGFVSDATSYDPSSANPLGALVSRDIPGRVAHFREIEANALQSAEAPAANAPMAKARSKWAFLSSPIGADEGEGPDSNGVPYRLNISEVRVAPFVQSQWNQAEADGKSPSCTSTCPCYNYYTPPNEPGNPANYVCGCGPTALAQVMRYFQHPKAGIGVVSGKYSISGGPQLRGKTLGGDGKGGAYDWVNMPLTTSSSTPLAQRQAIGRLTWDAGLAENANYDSGDGTSTDPDSASKALVNIFHYSNAIHGDNPVNNIPEADLYAMVNPNLHAKYPVIFTIHRVGGGHFVVCDGYGYMASTIYHHLNMGWSGTDDVWYNLPTIDAVNKHEIYTSIRECTYNIYTSGRGEIIAGRVIDVVGNPISRAKVQLNGQDGRLRFTTTDAKGVFAFTKVPSGTAYTITVAKKGYSFRRKRVSTGTSIDYRIHAGNVWMQDLKAIGKVPAAPKKNDGSWNASRQYLLYNFIHC